MSRPSMFDENCDVCGRVINEAPFYEGFTVGSTEYCDSCLEKHYPQKYEKHRKAKSEKEFWRKQREGE